MDKINDGGSAFPRFPVMMKNPDGTITKQDLGISMRDYFAAKAMPSVYEEYVMDAREQGFVEDWKMGVALDAYEMADAMLRAREAT